MRVDGCVCVRLTRLRAALLVSVCLALAGCMPPPPPVSTSPPPPALNQAWFFGIERMRGDPLLLAPYTNRFLSGLAAMPQVRVVYLGGEPNQFLFNSWGKPRLRVMSWLRGEGSCMQITYTITVSGVQDATFGLVVPPLPAGPEPDSACVDRAAAEFYRALVVQGL